MIFSLEVRRALCGDCLLLHYGTPDDPGLMLIDGGPGDVYQQHLRPRLVEIRRARGLADDRPLAIDALMVSHIDDDHMKGILDLTRELVEAQECREPALARIRNVWHNTFDDIVGNSAKELTAAITAAFGAAALDGDPDVEGLDETAAKVLASVSEGIRLRDDAKKLAVPVNRAFDGRLIMATAGAGKLDLGKGLCATVAGPIKDELIALQKEHDAFLKEQKKRGKKTVPAAFTDTSVPNLSSLIVLAEAAGKRILLTGDARGDRVVEGLELRGVLQKGGAVHVQILKMPHHGSSRNLAPVFFQRITADHYVFSGDGEYGNPDRETFEMLKQARPRGDYEIHLTYPVDDIDEERKKDWNTQRQKQKKRGAAAAPAWKPETNSLASFFAANPDMAARVRIADPAAPHVINLLDAITF